MMNFQNLNKNKHQFSPKKGDGREDTFRPINLTGRTESKRPTDNDIVDVDMESVLKRVAVFFGFALLAISIYFSYDGFDSSVNGSNPNYSTLAKIIGVILAIIVSLMEFIFSSSYKSLNATLKFFGISSYAYSMWTNYQGITHVLQMSQVTAIVATLFVDGVAEPLIAWGLGASNNGDVLGNLFRIMFGSRRSENRRHQYEVQDEFKQRIGK